MAEHGIEGGLGAPTRHPLKQHDAKFWDEDDLNQELERVYDICHTCRRCVSLCDSFPTLFNLIDASGTMEVDGVAVTDYTNVVDQCYLCDLCYLTKCPYVPPHEWNLDFPHLMLRAKAIKFKKRDTKSRDNIITSTDMVGKMASLPLVNSGYKNSAVQAALDSGLGIYKHAKLPEYHRKTARKQHAVKIYNPQDNLGSESKAASAKTDHLSRVALFTTCY